MSALTTLDTDVAVLGEWRASGPLSHELEDAGYTFQAGAPDPTGGYASVLIASRRPLEPGTISYPDASDRHRFQHVVVDGWSIGGAYIPGYEPSNDRKRRYWEFLIGEWVREVDEPALLCGDFNTGLWYRDEDGATLHSHDQHAALEAAGWRDAWIERNPRSRPPSSWYSNYGNGFRLDHALLSPNAHRALSVDYPRVIGDDEVLGPGGLSDHLPVVVTLRTAS